MVAEKSTGRRKEENDAARHGGGKERKKKIRYLGIRFGLAPASLAATPCDVEGPSLGAAIATLCPLIKDTSHLPPRFHRLVQNNPLRSIILVNCSSNDKFLRPFRLGLLSSEGRMCGK